MKYYNVFFYVFTSSSTKSLTNQPLFMSRLIYDYTKTVLERVSFDSKLFRKELEKAIKVLLPYEIEQLTEWLFSFTKERPDLRQCLLSINK